MAFLPTEEVFCEGVTEPQREILREIYSRTVQMSKKGVPAKHIMNTYQFYNLEKKNVR
jgi:hypothetical protein